MEIILATNNKNKVREISQKLKPFNIKVISQEEAGCNIEVEETSKTLKGNAELKAETIYKILGKPVIADDSGLEIDALNGEPGVYSKRYAGPNATDKERIEKVLNLMKDVEDNKRTAKIKCDICYIDNEAQKHFFEGICNVKITKEPIGSNGFGYDPIIMYNNRTFAQIPEEEKNKISHRGKAIEKLVKYIEENESK